MNDIIKHARIERLLNIAQAKGLEINFVDSYCDKDYPDTPYGLALANWNNKTRWIEATKNTEILDDTPERIAKLLEKLGVGIDWSDEYDICNYCNNAVRITHDSYSWQPQYILTEDGFVCNDCCDKDENIIKEHLETLEGDYKTAFNNYYFYPEEYGYKLLEIEPFQNGFYPGQDASPKLIADILEQVGVSRYLFSITNVGQFDMDFVVYIHESQSSKYDDALKAVANGQTNGPSVSENLKKTLQNAKFYEN